MKKETAIFAAGCFWGVQYYFEQVPGVLQTEAGYTGGYKDNPSYEEVYKHKTGHAEAVKVTFDPKKVSYETLLQHFFRIQDPTAQNAPDGVNVGDSYRSAIYYINEKQKEAAQKIIDKLNPEKYDGKIVTTLEPAGKWWLAEAYHQKFTEKTGRGMCHVPYASV
jgi:peptide methionine sulfoxide reductase msrA/msrB